ncbi:MAG: hypothetical protein M1834_000827 [Cirrosporium novae-zelandiae]|nr:MAG: hypothetical protein M1834_000827 [Cirrosporium novae-zelandiae]
MSSTGPRLIDRETGTRTKPMKVLVLGMCRTGTLSIYTALQKLGYTPYHMVEALNPPQKFDVWSECLLASHKGQGKVWGKEEFDKLLGNYDAVADVPCCLLVSELTSAYPDAKVILTTRPVDKWITSMQNTAIAMIRWRSLKILRYMDSEFIGPFYRYVLIVLEIVCGTPNQREWGGPKMRKEFLDHNDRVRAIVPKENLLEFAPPYGWEPLCEFLGQPIPEGPYPRTNDKDHFSKKSAGMRNRVLGRLVKNFMIALSPVFVAMAGYFFYYRV